MNNLFINIADKRGLREQLRTELVNVYPYCGNYLIIISYWFKFIETSYLGSGASEVRSLFIDLLTELYEVTGNTKCPAKFTSNLNKTTSREIIYQCFKKNNYFDDRLDYRKTLKFQAIKPDAETVILRELLLPDSNEDLSISSLFNDDFIEAYFRQEKISVNTLLAAKNIITTELFYWIKAVIRILVIARNQQDLFNNIELDTLQSEMVLEYDDISSVVKKLFPIYRAAYGEVFEEKLIFEDFAILIDMVNRREDAFEAGESIFAPIKTQMEDFIYDASAKLISGYRFEDLLKQILLFIKEIDWDNAVNKAYGPVLKQVAVRLFYQELREKLVPAMSLEDIIETLLTCYEVHNYLNTL